MKNKIVFLLFSLSLIFSQNLIASGDEVCGTTSIVASAPYLPTTGNIKILVIFAQFKDDPNTDNNGWAKNSYPSWANNFINSSSGGSYPWYNLSHYFNEMSNGDYQVIGDVYNSLVVTNENFDDYSSIGEVNHEILLEVDPFVDFSDYDNLDGSSFGSDGIVDYIHIIYRNVEKRNDFMRTSQGYYSGIAKLELSSTITTDNVQIVSGSGIGGGVQQRSGYFGRDYTMYTAAHEMGHYLFGGNHINYTTNLCLMSALPVWNGSRGMHSWEREKLGWIDYTNKSTDGSVTLDDYMTDDEVYRIPVGSYEYFLIENRKKISPHDKAGDTGIYVYRVTSTTSFPPTIDVLCADGNWDFSFNTSTKVITRGDSNPSGKDEMNYIRYYDGDKYACFTPHYHENSAWGDNEDAFDLTFNNVLSPVSNPRSTNGGSIEFTLEVTGTNTIAFYFDGDSNGDEYAGSPSKPQNLEVAWDVNYPKLTWETNGEADMQVYAISKMVEGVTGYANVGTVTHNSSLSTHTWTDVHVTKPGKFDPNYTIYYKVKAKDSQNKYSLFSDEKEINGYTNYLWKRGNEEESNVIIMEYSLKQNYPNPFNPTTRISYQIPNDGFVSLIVYNSLGQIVEKLVDQTQAKGRYSVTFNAENLPSGIYFYKLQAGEFNKVNKMLLLK